jgi:hypothetical protein
MCNSENHKCNLPQKHLCSIALCWLMVACLPSVVLAQSPADPKAPMVWAPGLALDIKGVRSIFEEARVSASLRQGHPLTFGQLSSYPDRYRVLVEQLQSRFIAKQVKVSVTESEVAAVAGQIIKGVGVERAVINRSTQSSTPIHIERLASRLKTSNTFIVDAVTLEIKRRQLVDTLLDELPSNYMLINWFEQSLEVEFEAVTVPRVPTSREIDRAVIDLKVEIAEVYNARPGRFNKPPKILATRIRVPWSQTRSSALDAQVRQHASRLRTERDAGGDLMSILKSAGDDYAVRKKGHVTLNARKYPKLLALGKDERSDMFEDERGVGFYEIKMHAPAYARKLSEQTVQRELAAELLRLRDTLPTAYRKAQAIADTWVSRPDLVDEELKNIQGSRRIPLSRFAPFASSLIPGLGTSESGSDRIKALRGHEVSGQPVWIRQDYVIFRVGDWQVPNLGEWWENAPAYWAEYEPKARRQLLHQWLTSKFPKTSIEVDGEAISKLIL